MDRMNLKHCYHQQIAARADASATAPMCKSSSIMIAVRFKRIRSNACVAGTLVYLFRGAAGPVAGAVLPLVQSRSNLRTRTVEPIDFHFGFGNQSLFVSGHARRGAELHVPIAMNTEAELPATVIAAQRSWGCAQTVASATHHNTYGEQIKDAAASMCERPQAWHSNV